MEPSRHSEKYIDELIAGAGSTLDMAPTSTFATSGTTKEWSSLDAEAKERLLDAHFAPSGDLEAAAGSDGGIGQGGEKMGRVARMRLRQSRRRLCIVVALLVACWILGGAWVAYARSGRISPAMRHHPSGDAGFAMDETMASAAGMSDIGAARHGGHMDRVKSTFDKVTSAASAAAEKGKHAASAAAQKGKSAMSAAKDKLDKPQQQQPPQGGKSSIAEDDAKQDKLHTPGQPQTQGQINARPPATDLHPEPIAGEKGVKSSADSADGAARKDDKSAGSKDDKSGGADKKKPPTAPPADNTKETLAAANAVAAAGKLESETSSLAEAARGSDKPAKSGAGAASAEKDVKSAGKKVEPETKGKTASTAGSETTGAAAGAGAGAGGKTGTKSQAQEHAENVALAEHAESSRDAADANLLNAARAGG